MFAAIMGHFEIVKELISHEGIDINCKTIFVQINSWYSNPSFFILFKLEIIYGVYLNSV